MGNSQINRDTYNALIRKYDVPTPRYTSYPTVPCWRTEEFSRDQWTEAVTQTCARSNEQKGISLYLHLPFCESLCTYCACTTRITRNHAVEMPYMDALIAEWQHYRQQLGEVPVVREIHLGGGTPTFFDPENLRRLIQRLLEDVRLKEDFSFSFEGHPNNTTGAHLQALYDVGFRRVSFGVQDLDEQVQRAIHRIQPYENLCRATEQARNIGYTSISYDLVYGLPFQTESTIETTLKSVVQLHPDRLAFYSYAHVPWLKPGQRGYSEADLPTSTVKRRLYELGRDVLHDGGYVDVGMDHFALPHDELHQARVHRRLHRNFMGYTTSNADLLVGLGASAISDAYHAYAQNEKKVEEYVNRIHDEGTAIVKGHIMSSDDLLRRSCILQISCQGMLERSLLEQVTNADIAVALSVMAGEGLISYSNSGDLQVTDLGQPFLRNICGVFDRYLRQVSSDQPVFSKSI